MYNSDSITHGDGGRAAVLSGNGLTGRAAIDFEAVTDDPTDGMLPRGAYAAKILMVTDREDEQRVECLFDVAEGEQAGFFAEYGPKQDYMRTLRISYTRPALKFAKRTLSAIGQSNPGFDAFAAWKSDLHAFEGKLFGLIVSYRFQKDMYGGTRAWPNYDAVPIPVLRSGDFTIPGDVREDGTHGEPTPGVAIPESEHVSASPAHEVDDLWSNNDAR